MPEGRERDCQGDVMEDPTGTEGARTDNPTDSQESPSGALKSWADQDRGSRHMHFFEKILDPCKNTVFSR